LHFLSVGESVEQLQPFVLEELSSGWAHGGLDAEWVMRKLTLRFSMDLMPDVRAWEYNPVKTLNEKGRVARCGVESPAGLNGN